MEACFDAKHATLTLERGGRYDCAGNIFWLKLTHLTQPGVPINHRSIEIIKETKFANPSRILEQFVIAVPPGVSGQSLSTLRGAFEIVSPEEVVHALMHRIAERLPEAEEAEMWEWRTVCLTACFVFDKMDGPEAVYWRSVNLREKIISEYEALARDVCQRIMELVAYRDLMKRTQNKELSNAGLAEAWKSHVAQCDSSASERITESFVDTAMKLYNRLFTPDTLAIIMQAADRYGKASPFNSASSLEQITMKGKSQEKMIWIMRSIMDSLDHLPNEFGVQNFTFRMLKGVSGAVGYIQLCLAKLDLMDHFVSTVLCKFPRDSFKDFVKVNLLGHETFRKHCGSPSHAADLSWQAEYTDSEIQAVQFLKNVIYNSVLDGRLKTVLKGSTNIEDLMASQKISELVSEMLESLEGEQNPSGKDVVADRALEQEEASVSLASLVASDLLEDPERAKELEEHFRSIKEHTSRYVTFTPSEQSTTKTQQLLEATVLPRLPSSTKGKYWAIWYDTKAQGESSAQPHCRVPAFQKATFKKRVQAALAAHQQDSLGDNTLVLAMDGMRRIDNELTSSIVRVDGEAIARVKSTFHVAYDEKTLRARKCLTRGLVPQIEGLHVYGTEAVALQDRARKTYPGTTHGSLIGPVEVDPYKAGFLVSKECKEKMLGDHGKILAGGPCPAPTPLPDLDEKVPASFYALPVAFYAEMVHSFELGGIYDATTMDCNFALACLQMKVPYVGSCLSEFACQVFEAEIVRQCWQEFMTPESELYDPSLHKLVNQKKASTPGKSKGSKGRGKGRGRGRGKGKGEAVSEADVGGAGAGEGQGKGGSKGQTEAEIVKALAALGQ